MNETSINAYKQSDLATYYSSFVENKPRNLTFYSQPRAAYKYVNALGSAIARAYEGLSFPKGHLKINSSVKR